MNVEIFKSERYFTIWEYTVSHGQLLLRSDKRKGYKNNIDIVFGATNYVQLFSALSGLTIRMVDKKMMTNYDSLNRHLNHENNNLFEIESQNEKYYIAASFVKVYENDLEFYETSLGEKYKERQKKIAGSI